MLQDFEGACLKVCGGCDGRSEGRTEYGQIGIRIGRSEVGIYKRKQENKNSNKRAIKKTRKKAETRPRKKKKKIFFS